MCSLICKICTVQKYCWAQPSWKIHSRYSIVIDLTDHWNKLDSVYFQACLYNQTSNLKGDTSCHFVSTLDFDPLDHFQSHPHTAWQTLISISGSHTTNAHMHIPNTQSDRSCLQLTGFFISKDIKPPTPTFPPPLTLWPCHDERCDNLLCDSSAHTMAHIYTHTFQRQTQWLSEHKMIEGKKGSI